MLHICPAVGRRRIRDRRSNYACDHHTVKLGAIVVQLHVDVGRCCGDIRVVHTVVRDAVNAELDWFVVVNVFAFDSPEVILESILAVRRY
jgi:hypothetical protein